MAMVLLGLLLLVLKLAEFGPVGPWPWWAVLSPFGAAALWWYWADASGWTKRREMDKMTARKRERRKKNLESLGLGADEQRRRR